MEPTLSIPSRFQPVRAIDRHSESDKSAEIHERIINRERYGLGVVMTLHRERGSVLCADVRSDAVKFIVMLKHTVPSELSHLVVSFVK